MKPQLLSGPARQAALRKKLVRAVKRPWRKWFKNLLRCLIRAYAPTLDDKWAVAQLEASIGGPLAHKPEPRADQEARLMGHLEAVSDYYSERLAKASDSQLSLEVMELRPKLAAEMSKMREQLRQDSDNLPFHERAEYQSAFADAYAKTFTPLGELRGATLATPIHRYLLAWCIIGLAVERPPRSVAELLRWTWHFEKRPKPSVTRDGRDPREQETRRVQKVCERLGLRFGVGSRKPRKQRPKRSPRPTRP